MAFRVYDTEKKIWIKDNIYLNPDGDLFKIKQSLFGMIKLPLALDAYRYVYHRDIGLVDMDGRAIYEGDYIEAHVGKVDEEDENSEDKTVIGIVAYASELSAYVILCVDSNEFYTLGSSVSNEIKIIGNVFEGYER